MWLVQYLFLETSRAKEITDYVFVSVCEFEVFHCTDVNDDKRYR